MSTAVGVVHNSDGSVVAAPSVSRMRILRPLASPTEILGAQEETRAFLAAALVEGRDYGTFPGVDKKSLFKAGAERSCLAFGLMPRFTILEKEIDHERVVPWRKVKAKYEGPRGNRVKVGEEVTEGSSLGLYRYVVACDLVARDTGEVVGNAIASCSTLESKYIDRPRDAENTVLQMAEKRAHVAATRTGLGLSEQFTQDIEDDPERFAKKDGVADDDAVKCPKCKGAMWDNRAKNDEREKEGKKRMPDYKCKDQQCQEVIWDAAKFAEELARNDAVAAGAAPAADPAARLAQANARAFPWPSHKKYGGKPLADASTTMLLTVSKWCKEELEAPTVSEENRQRLLALQSDVVLILESRPDLEAAITALEAKGKEGEQRPDPTPSSTPPSAPTSSGGSSTKPVTKTSVTPSSAAPTAPAPSSVAAAAEPTVQELQRAADTAAQETASADPAIAKQTLALLTGTLFNLLGDEKYAKPTRDKVRARLAGTEDLSAPVLQAAIAEIEAAKLPF